MPYRRLPNTDKARLRALAGSYRKFESDEHSNLPYSETALQQLRETFPAFRNALVNLEAARKQQSEKNKDFSETFRKSKLYVQHYLQCMNFAIQRGEVKNNIRAYYGTEAFENTLPSIHTEEQLLKWGKKVIEGDQQRIMKGGSPFYNPSIALVKINFEKFTEAYRFQKTLEATTERGVKLVKELRMAADTLILRLWNEIEAHYQHLPEEDRRSNCEAFGLVYVLRRKERKRLLAQQNPEIVATVSNEDEVSIQTAQKQQTIENEQKPEELKDAQQVPVKEVPAEMIIESAEKHIDESAVQHPVKQAPKKVAAEKPKATEPETEKSKPRVYQSELNFF